MDFLSNAIVHNNQRVKIAVRLKQKERLRILIIDDGKGMGAENLEHIFDRYYRVTNTGAIHHGSDNRS